MVPSELTFEPRARFLNDRPASVVAAGLILGFPLAWAAARAVHSLLFGIAAVDPLAFGGTGAVLIAGVGRGVSPRAPRCIHRPDARPAA